MKATFIPTWPHPLQRLARLTCLTWLGVGSAWAQQPPATDLEPTLTPIVTETVTPVEASSPPPPAHSASTCRVLTEKAGNVDLEVAHAQAQRQEAAHIATLLDRAIALWGEAGQRCEGRAQERAQRNLADSERSRQALSLHLSASPECTNGQKSAQSLTELAQRALKERRWTDAAMLFRKAENQWDVAAEFCTEQHQQDAQTKRDQAALDAHNAEFCAPPFEKAREQEQQFRRSGPTLSVLERQNQSQITETLWRDALDQCKGPAQELAKTKAQNIARDRGTAWVPTARPDLPLSTTITAATTAAATVKPTAQAPATAVAAKAVPQATPAPVAPEPRHAPVQRSAPPSPPAKAQETAPSPPPPPAPREWVNGDTRIQGVFTGTVDKLTGHGQIRWGNGDHYQGDLLEGQRHGQGTFTWANGQRYSGQWDHDTPQGQGQLVFANGNRYEGLVSQGLPQGKGQLTYASGDRYEGVFQQGNPAGRGLYRWSNGQTWDGDWKDSQPHGPGRLRYANGNVYEGPMIAGQATGQGRLTFASGDQYQGELVNGTPSGQGEYRWANGDRYSGQWVNGEKHGHGTMEWAHGDRWEGPFVHNAPGAPVPPQKGS